MTQAFSKDDLPKLIEIVKHNIGSWYAIEGRLFEILNVRVIDETWPPNFEWNLRSIPIEGEAVVEGWVTDNWIDRKSWVLIRKKPLLAKEVIAEILQT